jgi:hypothetical protein
MYVCIYINKGTPLRACHICICICEALGLKPRLYMPQNKKPLIYISLSKGVKQDTESSLVTKLL